MPPDGRDRPPKKRRWLAWIIVFVVVGLLLLPILHKSRASSAPPPRGAGGSPAVSTEVVQIGTMPITIDALGTVVPRQNVSVYSQVTGRVLAVRYTEGQIVHKGDVLVEIDQRPIEAQLQQAEGTLQRDKATLDQAGINLKRYQEAYAEKALPQQTVFDQEAALRQSQGSVLNDQGQVSYYQVQLSYYKIIAPLTGRIGLRLVDPGNTVFQGSGTTIATIAEVSPITVVFAIAEDHLPRVRQQLAKHSDGLVVDLFERSLTTKIASGKLLTFDNQVDPATGTVRLRALFENADAALFPNQFVNARLEVDVIQDAKLIPTAAIQYNGQQAFVWVLQPDGAVKVQNITVTVADPKRSAIDGLAPNATVVTSNFERLSDGAKVTVANKERPDGGAPGGTGPKR